MLPDPFPRMGARPETVDPQEASNTPRPVPQVDDRRRGTEESHTKGRGGWARKKKMGEVLVTGATVRTKRRRRTAYSKEIRGEKSGMPVAPKTGEGATGGTGKGLLLRRDKGDPMAKVAERDRRSPRGKKRKAKKGAKGSKRLWSRRGSGRGGGTRLGQGIGQLVADNPGVSRYPL